MKILLILLCLFVTTKSQAQGVWAPSGATWWYSTSNFGFEGYIKIQYIGDSIVDGKNCKALSKEIHGFNYFTMTYVDGVYDTTITFFQNDSVYHYVDNQFYLLYDFNGIPSNVWEVDTMDTYCDPDSLSVVVIDSIGTVTINSILLKWVSVSPTTNTSQGLEGKIIERIGSHDFFMLPEYVSCLFDAQEGGPLRCYYDDSFGLYQKPNCPVCDFIIGIDQTSTTEFQFSIYPNPSTDFITVEFPNYQGTQFEIEIISALGVKIMSVSTESNSVKIDLSELSNGIYYLNLSTEGNRIATKRIVKNAA